MTLQKKGRSRNAVFMLNKGRLITAIMSIMAIAFIFWQASVVQQAAETLDNGVRPLGSVVEPPPPGPIYLENDSYYWLSMAERMRNEGVFRIRTTDADNAPFGRPVYWSQSIAWMMHLISWCPGISHLPSPLVSASFWVNPVLQSIGVLGLFFFLTPLGARLASFAILGFVSLGDIAWAYSSLRPDHQSLQVLFLIFMILPLLARGFGFGTMALRIEEEHNRGSLWMFAISGIATGAGLWISAAAMMPILIVLAGAVCAFNLFWSDKPDDVLTATRGWCLWGGVAGVASIVFWLIEFFPHIEATRLEVNNPAFSLWVALLGLGISLSFKLRWAVSRKRRLVLGSLALVVALCILLPGVILFGPAAWYWPRYIYMDRLHNFIMEFYTYPNFTKGNVISGLFKTYQTTIPLALLLVIPAFSATRVCQRMACRILLLLLLGLFAMSFRQIRWFALFAPILAVSTALSANYLIDSLKVKGAGLRVAAAAIFIAFIAQNVVFAQSQLKSFLDVASGKTVLNELIPPVLNKRFASALGSLPASLKPTAVLADPDLAPALHYFAKVPTVVSFYWENIDGARDFARFLADSDGDEAKKIAENRNLSHVIVPSGYLLSNYVYYMINGAYDRQKARENLAASLSGDGNMPKPSWIEADYELDRIGKIPFTYRGETLEQFLNVYTINLQK